MGDRKYMASYMGSKDHAPHNLRGEMLKMMGHWNNNEQNLTYVGRSPNWREVMRNSKVQLAPRGFGRTSYHVVEILQSGLIPVHVYSDVPWMPYQNLMQKVSFTTSIDDFPEFMKKLAKIDDAKLEQMENEVARLYESHFTKKGIMKHIADFMKHGKGDLRCQNLPKTIRHEGSIDHD